MKELINNNGKMTSLEISELSGKRHADLMRDIRKMEETWVNLDESKFTLISYIDTQNRAKPMYELTKTECLYIATKFNDEARAKLVLRWQQLEEDKHKPLSQIDLIIQSAQRLKAIELKEQEHDNRIKVLEAKSTLHPDFFTIAGYGTLIGVPINLKLASSLGRKASKICRELRIETGDLPDPRFGIVKTYPKEVLEKVFNQNVA